MSAARLLQIALLGASGRMGQAVNAVIADAPDLVVSGHWSGEPGESIATALAGAEVAIDFSAPEATAALSAAIEAAGIPLVTGTTGHTAAELETLTTLAASVPVLHDGNMSVGIALLTALVAQAAAALPGHDIEILEAHHRQKRDAPSGTALKLGQAAAAARESGTEVFETGERVGARDDATIGFAVVRGGQVIGEHSVQFLGTHDVIELSHRATDRRLFAAGAVQAARWLVGKEAGFYRIADVVNTPAAGSA